MKKVLRYCAELEFDDKQPDSFQQVMDEVKDMLDEAPAGKLLQNQAILACSTVEA